MVEVQTDNTWLYVVDTFRTKGGQGKGQKGKKQKKREQAEAAPAQAHKSTIAVPDLGALCIWTLMSCVHTPM